MANNFGKGIKVTSGFDLSAKAPLDNRTVVDTISERDAHISQNRAYEGLKVFVISEKKEYLYDGSGWIESGGLTDEQFSQLITAYAHSLTEHASKEAIDEELEEMNKKINSLPTMELVNSKADLGHNHNDSYYTIDQMDQKLSEIVAGGIIDLESYAKKTDLQEGLSSKAELVHDHNDFYFTKVEVEEKIAQAMLDGEIDLSEYVTNTDFTERLYSKSDIGHGHTPSDIEGLDELFADSYTKTEVDNAIVSAKTEAIAYSDTAIANLVDSAPETMNTLNELAKAINESRDVYDAYVGTINSQLSGKADITHAHNDMYYTQNQVDEKIAKAVTDGQVDLSNYATIANLAAKSDIGHGHTFSDIEGLADELNLKADLNIVATKTDMAGKADIIHNHDISEISNLFETLESKADKANTYNKEDLDSQFNIINNAISSKSDLGHEHNDTYYTKNEVDEAITKVATDGIVSLENYATKAELSQGLETRSLIGHNHTPSDIEGLSDLFENVYEKSEIDNLIISSKTEAMAYADTAVANLVDSAPEALNTLNELASEINKNHTIFETYVATVADQLSSKAELGHNHDTEYYTKEEVEQLINTGIDGVDLSNLVTKGEFEQGMNSKAELTHNHDGVYAPMQHEHGDLYLTEDEIDDKLVLSESAAVTKAVTEANAYTEGRVLEILGNGTGSLGELANLLSEHKEEFEQYKDSVNNSLAGKSDLGHGHDELYAQLIHNHKVADITDINQYYYNKEEIEGALYTKAEINHNHNDIYYTQTQVDEKILEGVNGIDLSVLATKEELTSGLATKSELGHTHDYADLKHNHVTQEITDLFDKVYTKQEVDTGLSAKAELGHLHHEIYSQLGHTHNLNDLHGLDDVYYTKSEIDSALATKAELGHSHSLEMIYGLPEALDLKADKATAATKDELSQGLSQKAELNHFHDDRYAMKSHDHTGLYLTRNEIEEIVEEECGQAVIQATTQSNAYTDGKILEILGGEDGGENTLSGLAKSIEEHIDDFNAYKSSLSLELSRKSDLGHGHEISEITNLQNTLDNKATKNEVGSLNSNLLEKIEQARVLAETNSQAYTETVVAGLIDGAPDALNTLNELAEAIQNHQDVYEAYVANIANALATKSDIGHNHDGVYYTKLQVDNIIDSKIGDIDFSAFALRTELATKADLNHNHNDVYSAIGHKHTTSDISNLYDNVYSKVAIDGFLGSKADLNHNHNDLYYTKLEVDENIMAKLDEIDLSEYVTNEALEETLRTKADASHFHDDAYYRKWQIDAKFNGLGLSGFATLEDLTNWSTQFALKNHTHDGMSATVEEETIISMLSTIFKK